MKAEEHLSELKKIATAVRKQATLAATHEGLALVDGARLAALENLCVKCKAVIESSYTTREYGMAEGGDTYNGKRFVTPRAEFQELLNSMHKLGERVKCCMGARVEG